MDSLAAVDWTAYEQEALTAIADGALEDARVRYLGRKSELAQALRGVRDRESGMLAERRSARASRRRSTERERQVGPRRLRGGCRARHRRDDPRDAGRRAAGCTCSRRSAARSRTSSSAWATRSGTAPRSSTVWENFDALNTDPGHPSRSKLDTFYLDDDTILRTQTSPDQIKAMLTRKPPIYMVSPGRVYRRDTPDATHSPTFQQVECLAVDRGITLADLRGTVLQFFRAALRARARGPHAHELLPVHRAVGRVRRHLLPLQRPRAARCASTPAGSRWAAPAGSTPTCSATSNLDPDEWQGFAFGFGIERIAMLRHGLPDLRAFWENDIRVLGQF